MQAAIVSPPQSEVSLDQGIIGVVVGSFDRRMPSKGLENYHVPRACWLTREDLRGAFAHSSGIEVAFGRLKKNEERCYEEDLCSFTLCIDCAMQLELQIVQQSFHRNTNPITRMD